jgi:hypothetical protein
MTASYDPAWYPLWAVAEETLLPVNFHTIGGGRTALETIRPLQ